MGPPQSSKIEDRSSKIEVRKGFLIFVFRTLVFAGRQRPSPQGQRLPTRGPGVRSGNLNGLRRGSRIAILNDGTQPTDGRASRAMSPYARGGRIAHTFDGAEK